MPKDLKDIDSSFLEIDHDSLDEEWLSQPELFHKYSTKEAWYERRLDEAKAELDVTKAELDKNIRSKPDVYGVKKVTDKAVEAAMVLRDNYQDALEAVTLAKYNYNIARAARIALDQRKVALENLVKLHGQNYFSNPKASDEVSREVVDDIERRSRRKKQALKRRKDDEDDD